MRAKCSPALMHARASVLRRDLPTQAQCLPILPLPPATSARAKATGDDGNATGAMCTATVSAAAAAAAAAAWWCS